jgi:hypothetical protein
MKGFLKFFGIFFGGFVLVVLAIWALLGYWASLDSQPASTVSAVQSNPKADNEGVFGSYRFTYTRQSGVVAATFTPFLARDDATVVNAIRRVVRAAYGADITAVSPVLAGQDIAFAAPTATYYVTLIKQDSGEVHSFTIRTSP